MRWVACFLLAVLVTAAQARELPLTGQYEVAQHMGGGVFNRGPLVLPPAAGDPTSNVLPAVNDSIANWQMAGLQSLGGIATVDAGRVNCTTAQAGETLPLAASGINIVSAGDDFHNIQQAINNCPANTIIRLATGAFTLDESQFILMNKSQTLTGGDSCPGSTNHAYCGTTIVKRNGAVAYNLTVTCGTTCLGTPVVMMSPNGQFNDDWSGCHDNTTGGTQDGNTCAGTVATLTADAAQGATTVSVSTTTPFSVGQWVLIDEDPAASFITDPVSRGTVSPTVFASPDMFSTSGSPATGRIAYLYFSPNPGYGATTTGGSGTCTGGGCPGALGESCAYAATCFRPVGEIHLITAVNPGVSITFDSPLTIAMRQSGGHNAHVYYPTAQAGATYTPFLQKAFLENVTLGRGDGSNVFISHCAYCAVYNVDSYWWAGGAVNINASARVEVNHVYGYDCANNQNNGNEYVYSFNSATTEAYIVDSITRLSGKSMVARAGGAGSVVAYNYMDDNMYEFDSSLGNPNTNWIDLSANASHFPGSHHVLFEGNHAVNGGADMTHGSGANYMTYFRNHLAGYRTPYTDPSNSVAVNDFTNTPKAPGNVRAFGISSYNYWHGVVGNVLGTSGFSTAGNGWTYNSSSYLRGSNFNIFETIDEYTQDSRHDPNQDFTSSTKFFFEHANYDYVNASVADFATGTPCGTGIACSHTLPNSFYLSSTPAFFSPSGTCTYPWPWVTPTAGTQLPAPTGTGCSAFSGLPAMARFQAGTPFVQP